MYKWLILMPLLLGIVTIDMQAELDEDSCSSEILFSFFPSPFVKKTLEKYQVPTKEHAKIIDELTQKDGNVIEIVESRASKMSPNPLENPDQRSEATKLFRNTLIEIFSESMNPRGYSDPKILQEMLDDIQMQKAERFSKCWDKIKSEETTAGQRRR